MRSPRSVRAGSLALAGTLAATAVSLAGVASAATAGEALAPLVGAERPEAVAGEYVVVLEPDAGAERLTAATAAARAYGGSVSAEFRSALTGFAATLPLAGLAAVRAMDGVQLVEANLQFDLRDLAVGTAAPDDVQRDATWGLDRSDQRKLPLDTKYRYRSTGAGVRAYIIDSGMRVSHDDFDGRAEYGWDVVGDDEEAPDCFGHGTHVGGTVGSETYGIAKDVAIVSVNTCFGSGQTSSAYVIEAVDWVTEHAERPAVTNMSLGFALGAGVAEAVRGSIRTGITYVVSAGNSAGPSCDLEPATVRKAITVAATTIDDEQAGFSSYGECVDLYAPGVDITSLGHTSDRATAVFSGTSMSAPHVTGVAALYLELHPRADPHKVAREIKQAATRRQLRDLGPGSPNKLLYSRVG